MAGLFSTAVAAALVAAAPASAHQRSYAARTIHRQGYLVPHQARYERAKRNAAARSALEPRVPRPAAGPAAVLASFDGLKGGNAAPPDTTGAIGPTRYIEMVNARFAIFDRSAHSISRGLIRDLIGARRGDLLTDPQVIWDPGTGRFYYAEIESPDPRRNYIAFGFSKTGSPNGAAGFCRYRIGFGESFPDFPKLGDTSDFILVGVHSFAGRFFEGTDVAWAAKPPPGAHCPSSLASGKARNLRTATGARAFTAVPANQIDDSGQGWVVATRNTFGTQDAVTVFSVRRGDDGRAVIQGTGVNVPVKSFDFPNNAPQAGSSQVIDTSDGRLTQAVSAVDPSIPGAPATIWTQHTVKSGNRSRVEWYEIDPAAGSLVTEGAAADSSLFAFNGAISPDRAVNAGIGTFGQNMVLVYDTSSRSAKPAVQVVSKLAGAPQSGPTLVRSSTTSITRPCRGSCRWGDYSGATPDPVPPAGTSRVWAASQWQGGTGQFGWRTVNFVAAP